MHKHFSLNIHTLEELESGKLIGIKQLKMSCGLTHFPEAIFSLTDTLEILDLSSNQLSTLPNDFTKLKNLKILFLSDNKFTVFPEVLGQCKSITMIGFKANQIHRISETALHSAIRWLILTNNQLEALPTSIGNCWNMQKLALAGNKLSALPNELANCKNLGLIRISANQLQTFPEWLLNMPKLSWLAFAGNPFCYKPVIDADLQEIDWNELTVSYQLGEGASGVISKAVWQQNNNQTQDVAVKVFKGAVTSDGLPEDEMNACILASKHEGLLTVIGKIKNHPQKKEGLVLKLIPQTFYNLGLPPSYESCTRDVFNAGSVFTTEQIIKIASTIAGAAAHLHAKGILHGDLYAHNILVNDSAESLLGDFGAATIYDVNNVVTANGLEKIEVLAFGCLLEDLLGLVQPNETSDKTVNALTLLKENTMQSDVLNRPNFEEICQSLEQINQHRFV